MLRDHFHPPFSDRFGWKSFHGQWAAVITADLNRRLPPGWRAAGEAEFGIEIDVGLVDDRQSGESTANETHAQSWQPGEPTLTIPFTLTTDVVEIRVINSSYGPELVGAIELVSPANKNSNSGATAFPRYQPVSRAGSLRTKRMVFSQFAGFGITPALANLRMVSLRRVR